MGEHVLKEMLTAGLRKVTNNTSAASANQTSPDVINTKLALPMYAAVLLLSQLIMYSRRRAAATLPGASSIDNERKLVAN